ncbi:MAG: hypothetical protein ACOX7R_04110 [Acetivibrionales bacterium]
MAGNLVVFFRLPAIQNAASVAAMILTTGLSIHRKNSGIALIFIASSFVEP